MAHRGLKRDFDIIDLKIHVASGGRLARLTRGLRDRLDEFLYVLLPERRVAVVAYRSDTSLRPALAPVLVKSGTVQVGLFKSALAWVLGAAIATVKKMASAGQPPLSRKDQRRMFSTRSNFEKNINAYAMRGKNALTPNGVSSR